MRLGAKQLDRLNSLGAARAFVVPDRISRRLVELGLCDAEPDGSFSRISSDGLRALADAADAGKVSLFKMPQKQED